MGAWQEIVDYTVPSNTTSVVLNSFGTITKDDFVKVVFTSDISSATAGGTSLFANTATSETGYHRQVLRGVGSTASATRSNNINRPFFSSSAESKYYSVSYLKLSENDKFNIFTNNATNSSNVDLTFAYVTCETSFSSGINTLTFAQSTHLINAGSRIQIYKLAAEKVADITVASNTTQVDISNLSIDKDSEYLLVSDVATGAGSNDLYLTPNDLTTASGYYNQRILGESSNANALRQNSPRIFQISGSGGGTIAYTHIKLSNIGAFTAQSYSLFGQGSSTLYVINYFVSSTAENITSITKLNLISNVSNDIKAGSRFILYKLK